jgi:hypothetical protein
MQSWSLRTWRLGRDLAVNLDYFEERRVRRFAFVGVDGFPAGAPELLDASGAPQGVVTLLAFRRNL